LGAVLDSFYSLCEKKKKKKKDNILGAPVVATFPTKFRLETGERGEGKKKKGKKKEGENGEKEKREKLERLCFLLD